MPRLSHTSVSALLFLPCFLLLCALQSCHYKTGSDAWVVGGGNEVDSVDFRTAHHYWRGYNFMTTDSFSVLSRPPFLPELIYSRDTTTLIKRGDVIVVEAILRDTLSQPATIWVKIAAVDTRIPSAFADSLCASSGWVKEGEMLKSAVPDTPISKTIHALGSNAFKWGLTAVALLFSLCWMVCLRRRLFVVTHGNSLYPCLLSLLLSGSIVLHRSIWHFVPATWVEYYFYPSLNPLNPQLPPIIGLFLFSVWLLLVFGIATLVDLGHRTETAAQLVVHLLHLLWRNLLLFACFAVVIPFALLYVATLAYWIYTLRCYRRYRREHPMLYCGACGQPLSHLGRCPHCHANNH